MHQVQTRARRAILRDRVPILKVQRQQCVQTLPRELRERLRGTGEQPRSQGMS